MLLRIKKIFAVSWPETSPGSKYARVSVSRRDLVRKEARYSRAASDLISWQINGYGPFIICTSFIEVFDFQYYIILQNCKLIRDTKSFNIAL